MPSKLYDRNTGLMGLKSASDAVGAYIQFENGIKEYYLTTAITADVTVTTAAVGSFAKTTHATGRGKIFTSDGSKWQNTDT